jgi:hypothetical protein
MKALILISLLALLSIGLAHPTYYYKNKAQRNESCWNPKPVEIYSYHIHVLFWTNGEK